MSDDDDDFDINDYWGGLPEVHDDNDGDNDKDGEHKMPYAEHLLVLLDCSPDMFLPTVPMKMTQLKQFGEEEHGDILTSLEETENATTTATRTKMRSSVDAVLTALHEYLRQKVRISVTQKASHKKNGFGVTLFGTRKRPRWNVVEMAAAANSDANWNAKSNSNSGGAMINHHLNYVRGASHNKNNRKEDDHSGQDEKEEDSEDDSGDEDSKHATETTVHNLIPLEPHGIDAIKILRHCLPPSYYRGNYAASDSDDERVLNLEREFGHETGKNNNNVAEALHTALGGIAHIFRDATCVKSGPKKEDPKVGPAIKNIWIFTNNDDPTNGEDGNTKRLETIASDLRDNGCTIQIFPLSSFLDKSKTFNTSTFWGKIAQLPQDYSFYSNNRGGFDIKSLNQLVEGEWKRERRAHYVPLVFPDQVDAFTGTSGSNSEENTRPPCIMLELYSPVTLQKTPPYVKIMREIGMKDEDVEVARIVQKFVKDRGELIASFNRAEYDKDSKEQQSQQPKLHRLR